MFWLRYITALNTDELVLELEDSPYAINSWTTVARDCVTAWDTQEYDSTKFGVMQLRDEFKDVLSREMGLFGGPDGFESWMQINIHPTSTIQQRKRAHSLMLSFASTVNGALSTLVQGLTESVPCERCAALDGIKASESDREDEDNAVHGNNYSGEDADGDESTSANDEETEIEIDQNAKEAAEPSHRGQKQVPSNEAGPSNTSPNSPMQARMSSSPSPAPMHSQINVPSQSELFGSDGSGQIGGYVGDSQISTSQIVDDRIKGVTTNLASNLTKLKSQQTALPDSEKDIHNEIKVVVARELNIPLRIFMEPQQDEFENQGGQGREMEGGSNRQSDVVAEETVIQKSSVVEREPSVVSGSVVYNMDSTIVDL
ncbi:unnamed protein product [Alopecurus aequalis]